MSWNYLDGAVSLVDTGRWQAAHAPLYVAVDTVPVAGDRVIASPPGMSILLAPLYMVWRLVSGPAQTVAAFEAFHVFVVLLVAAPASALAAVQVAWLAGWFGASRRGCIASALLFAFGTQAFPFGTMLFKENVTALAFATALRLALAPGGAARRALAGGVAAAAASLVLPAAVFAPLVVLLVAAREGARRAVAVVAGCVPPVLALGLFNAWTFGRPWRTAYVVPIGAHAPGFVWPRLDVVAALLWGASGGLVLYAPFLLLGFAGMTRARRTEPGVVLVTLAAAVALLVTAAAWISQGVGSTTYATGLGARYLFPVVPLLAAFAAMPLEHGPRRVTATLAALSVLFGYLSAQAGFIPGGDVLPYALKTWISGTGMGPLFKEALPAWFGIDTLHTVVSRPDVSARDLMRMLPTAEGVRLARNQAALLAVNAAVAAGVALVVRRMWRAPAVVEPVCVS